MAAESSLIRLAVFGSPIAHSLSPTIHSRFAQQFGLDIDYQAIQSSVAEFPNKLRTLADSGALGCNITAPLKQAAFQAAGALSEDARLAEAVNTLHFRQERDWFGTTTDGGGLLNDLQRLLPEGLAGKRVLLIGAGGAAAGVLGSLLQQSLAALMIANRSSASAEQLVNRFAHLGPARTIALANTQSEPAFDLLINATSLGHQGLAPELPESCFAAGSLCYDLNYGQAALPWQSACQSAGIRFSDGLGMLVEQAALSFELWTGHKPATQTILEELREIQIKAQA